MHGGLPQLDAVWTRTSQGMSCEGWHAVDAVHVFLTDDTPELVVCTPDGSREARIPLPNTWQEARERDQLYRAQPEQEILVWKDERNGITIPDNVAWRVDAVSGREYCTFTGQPPLPPLPHAGEPRLLRDITRLARQLGVQLPDDVATAAWRKTSWGR